MTHAFTVQAAQALGIEAAILLQSIVFWSQRNALNRHNIKDGLAWTRNSLNAWLKLYPYMSKWKLRSALKALEDCGAVRIARSDEDPLDRAHWYAATSYGFELCGVPFVDPEGKNQEKSQQMHVAKSTQEMCENHTPQNSHNTVIYNNSKIRSITPPISPPEGEAGEESTVEEEGEQGKPVSEKRSIAQPEGFDRFWEAYPRKANKPAALKAFKRLRVGEALLSKILRALETYKGSEDWKRDGGQYIPYPSSWLNGERWLDVESAPTDAPSAPPLPSVTKPRSKREQREELASRAAREEGISFREAQIRYGLLHPSFRPPTPQEILDGHAQDVLQEGKRLNQLWEEQYLAEHPEWREDHE